MPNFDTGVAAVPAARPSVFTPSTATTVIPAPTAATDTGVAATPTSRPNTFDSTVVGTADPGDVLAN